MQRPLLALKDAVHAQLSFNDIVNHQSLVRQTPGL